MDSPLLDVAAASVGRLKQPVFDQPIYELVRENYINRYSKG
jgi:hypothetical protein